MQFGSSPPIYSNRAYYYFHANPRLEPERKRGEARLDRDTLDTKSSRRLGGGEKSGGMEKGSGVGIRSGVEFARKAKLVGGNLSRGAVRIHLNPPPPPSSFLRDSSFESLAEKDLVWPSEKRLKGDREGGGGRGG